MLRKAIVMKTLPKNIMSAPALDMCEKFAIDSDMGSVCLSYTDTGIDITDLAGLTLSEAIGKLPKFGIRALYWKDTDHRMQYGIAGEMWTKDYLSDLPTAWSVVDEVCDTLVWDCVITEFYYDMETGWFVIIIDEPTVGGLTRSTYNEDTDDIEVTMDTLYSTETLDTSINFLANEGKTITLASGKYGEYTVPTGKYNTAVSLLIKRALREDKDEIDYAALDEMLYPYHI